MQSIPQTVLELRRILLLHAEQACREKGIGCAEPPALGERGAVRRRCPLFFGAVLDPGTMSSVGGKTGAGLLYLRSWMSCRRIRIRRCGLERHGRDPDTSGSRRDDIGVPPLPGPQPFLPGWLCFVHVSAAARWRRSRRGRGLDQALGLEERGEAGVAGGIEGGGAQREAGQSVGEGAAVELVVELGRPWTNSAKLSSGGSRILDALLTASRKRRRRESSRAVSLAMKISSSRSARPPPRDRRRARAGPRARAGSARSCETPRSPRRPARRAAQARARSRR